MPGLRVPRLRSREWPRSASTLSPTDDPGTRSTHHCSNPNPARRLATVPNYPSSSGSQITNY